MSSVTWRRVMPYLITSPNFSSVSLNLSSNLSLPTSHTSLEMLLLITCLYHLNLTFHILSTIVTTPTLPHISLFIILSLFLFKKEKSNWKSHLCMDRILGLSPGYWDQVKKRVQTHPNKSQCLNLLIKFKMLLVIVFHFISEMPFPNIF